MSFNDYSNRLIDGQMCIWLQSYGWAPAKKACEFKAGERMLYNFGHTSEVLEVKEASKAFLSVTVKGSDGNNYTQRMKKDRFVAFKK